MEYLGTSSGEIQILMLPWSPLPPKATVAIKDKRLLPSNGIINNTASDMSNKSSD